MADAQFFHASILLLLALLSITYLPCFSTKAAATSNGGFRVELIRRDFPKSPFSSYGSRRSFGSAVISPEASQSLITPENGQYLLRLSVGTPARDIFAILDTGSDLFWVQCLPCERCYRQINPIFDPSKSSSYHDILCPSQQCQLVGSGSACSAANTCSYSYGYGSGSTQGSLATETVAITAKSGETVSFGNVVFGCGHNNSGTFNENEMGLIGFGKGPASFISQVGPSIGGRKFSYCLMPFNTDPKISSSIAFGSGSEVQGAGVITVPLVSTSDPTYYSLTLTGISVGTTFFPYSTSGPASLGNVILDSGTPPTLLPQDLYDRLAAEVKRQIPLAPIGGNLCYGNVQSFASPPLTLHFDGGVNLPLSTVQTFILMKDGSFCFAIQGYSDSAGIIGNFAQANFLIGYDLDKMTVSFKPADCTRFG